MDRFTTLRQEALATLSDLACYDPTGLVVERAMRRLATIRRTEADAAEV